MPGKDNKIESTNQNNNPENNNIININDTDNLESNLNINNEIGFDQLQKQSEIFVNYNGENIDSFIDKFPILIRKNNKTLELQKERQLEQEKANKTNEKLHKENNKAKSAKKSNQRDQQRSNSSNYTGNKISLNYLSTSEKEIYDNIVNNLKNCNTKFRYKILREITSRLNDYDSFSDALDLIELYCLTLGKKISLKEDDKNLDTAIDLTLEQMTVNKCLAISKTISDTKYKNSPQYTELQTLVSQLTPIEQEISNLATTAAKQMSTYNAKMTQLSFYYNELSSTNNKNKSGLYNTMYDDIKFFANQKNLNANTKYDINRSKNLTKALEHVDTYLAYARKKSFWHKFPWTTGYKRLCAANNLHQILTEASQAYEGCFEAQKNLEEKTLKKQQIKSKIKVLEQTHQKEASRYSRLEACSIKLNTAITSINLKPEQKSVIADYKTNFKSLSATEALDLSHKLKTNPDTIQNFKKRIPHSPKKNSNKEVKLLS